jgi:hypothetical protein
MTRVHFQSIKINRIERGSAVFQSKNNAPFDWKATKKENQGFGSIEGLGNKVKNSHSVVDDSDILDQN